MKDIQAEVGRIQAEVNRISWLQFVEATKPTSESKTAQAPFGRLSTVGDEEKLGRDELKEDAAAAATSAAQAGGCVAATPTPTQTPGHNTTRIEADEFAAIKEDGNLKHAWIYINACDDNARKVRVQSLTTNDVNIVYSNGGCLYAYAKTCIDWEKFNDFRIKFLVKRHYTHCRVKN
jgi:hypothetical protein